MRVGVTGASGFLGSHIAQVLVERGYEVVGIVRSPERAAHLAERGVELRRADLLDRGSLSVALYGLDALVSNAAPASEPSGGDIEAFVQADRAATTNVVEAALGAGVHRLVHISSVSVYRVFAPCRLIREDHPRRGPQERDLLSLLTRPGYAESKARSEEIVWEAAARGLLPTVLRPGPIYGSRDEKLTARYRRGLSGRLRLVPTVRLPHVHAGDVAMAVAGALKAQSSVGRAYNVTGEPVSLLSVARAARAASGASTWLLPVPIPLWIGWDNAAVCRDLGVSFRSLEEGLREALQ